ncbi:MAG: carbon-nitrogen hydrolase family protein [Deltaproteobacteria bacterium]|nr:carbon-nitrogen hydrolase family protein [Deltaproteobacteria bacterium]
MKEQEVVRVAAVQAAPIFLDKDGTIEKACKLIQEAGNNGAKLIVFPESFIPTFPYWSNYHPEGPPWARTFTKLFKNSVEIPSADTEILGKAAKQAGAYVVMGLNERDTIYGGSLYNTLLFLDPEGRIMGKHRKLMPTHHERLYWGCGDGSGLNVYSTAIGKLGGLICYEHHMTLSKYALYAQGEQIHCAVWPGWPGNPKYDNLDIVHTASRQYAFEGQCFVVCACGWIHPEMIPDDFEFKNEMDCQSRGGSTIITPLGTLLADPLLDQEGIVYGDLKMDLIIKAKAFVDCTGHYARWDVLSLNFNRRPHRAINSPQQPLQAVLQEEIAELLCRAEQLSHDELLDELRRLAGENLM